MNLSFSKIITGGSLESLFYAYMTETPIVICQPYIPFELEVMEYHEMFEFLGYTTNRPITKVELWDRLAFVLQRMMNDCGALKRSKLDINHQVTTISRIRFVKTAKRY